MNCHTHFKIVKSRLLTGIYSRLNIVGCNPPSKSYDLKKTSSLYKTGLLEVILECVTERARKADIRYATLRFSRLLHSPQLPQSGRKFGIRYVRENIAPTVGMPDMGEHNLFPYV